MKLETRTVRRTTWVGMMAWAWVAAGCYGQAGTDGAAPAGRVVIYPSPGDLSGVEGLKESKVFDLRVNGMDAFVYHGSEKNDKGLSGQGVSYGNFAFAGGPVTLDIVAQDEIGTWDIKPAVAGAEKVDAKTVRLTLEKPRKFLFTGELAGQGTQYFILSAEAPETDLPSATTAGVKYLGPGVHKFGQAWDPFVDGVHTLYVAGGAVVEATIKTKNKKNIKICGRGLFMQAFVPHAGQASRSGGPLKREWFADWMGTYIRSCRGVTVEGIAVLCSPSYQLELADCDNATVRNVTLCGFGERNNDGIHVYSRNVLVEDCFICGNDDRVCVTGLFDKDLPEAEAAVLKEEDRLTDTLVENVTLRRLVLWGLRNGGDIMLTWNAGQETRKVLIEDVESLAPTNAAFVAARHGGSGTIKDVLIRNCYLYHGNLVDVLVKGPACWGKGGGRIADFTLENIEMDAAPAQVGKRLAGQNERSDIGRATFKNIRARGQAITDVKETKIAVQPFVGKVEFVSGAGAQ